LTPPRSVCVLYHPRVHGNSDRLTEIEAFLAKLGVASWRHERDAGSRGLARRMRDTALVLTLGGDGTFLFGARLAGPHGVPVLGINLGRLGLLTELEPDGVEAGLTRFLDGDYRVEQRTLLSAALVRGAKVRERSLGLNEVMVHRSPSLKLIRFEMAMDQQQIGTIDADGVLVATATGSTAYSLALGGPILEPTLSDLVLVPMNPFALSVRPIVLNPDVEVRITLANNGASVVTDGYLTWTAEPGDAIRVHSFRRRLKLVRFGPPADFYRILREKIGWGTPLVPRPHA
jgi:NAD+ kinase